MPAAKSPPKDDGPFAVFEIPAGTTLYGVRDFGPAGKAIAKRYAAGEELSDVRVLVRYEGKGADPGGEGRIIRELRRRYGVPNGAVRFERSAANG